MELPCAIENVQKPVLGVRPQSFRLANPGDRSFHAQIDVVERLGPETYVYFQCEGTSASAQLPTHTPVEVGDTVELSIEENKIHVFDEHGKAVIHTAFSGDK